MAKPSAESYLELLNHVSRELEDVSSAEEDALKKKRQRELKLITPQLSSKRPKLANDTTPVIRPNVVTAAAEDLLSLSSQATFKQPTAGTLQLRPIEELLKQHNYMSTDKNGIPVCTIGKGKLLPDTPVVPIKSTTTTTIRRSNKSDSHLRMLKIFTEKPKVPVVTNTNPMYHELFQTMFESVPSPVFVRSSALGGALTQAEIDRKLHDKQLFLELMTCGLESELLKEGGRWKHEGKLYDFPVCVNDDKCIVFDPSSTFNAVTRHGSRRFKPCSIMTANEYYELITNHTPLSERRCCVMCHRYSVCMYVLNTRAIRLSNSDLIDQYDSKTILSKSAPVYQLIRNLYDHTDGYYKQVMLLPIQGDCIIEPVCRPMCSLLSTGIVPDSGGRMMINQEALRWKPHSDYTPHIGESLSHF